MKEAAETIWRLLWMSLGLAIAAFVIASALRWHGRMWRRVAGRLSGTSRTPSRARRFETIVIAERVRAGAKASLSGHRQYAGTWIDVHDDALAFSLVPPFNIGCPPIFLPFDRLSLAPTSWALWPDPFALGMRDVPDVEIILARDTVGWIRQHTDRAPFTAWNG